MIYYHYQMVTDAKNTPNHLYFISLGANSWIDGRNAYQVSKTLKFYKKKPFIQHFASVVWGNVYQIVLSIYLAKLDKIL